MKRILKLLLIITASWITRDLFAQLERSHVPPSPTVAPLASVDVGHYTGVASVSIPFHTLAGKDIAIPISIDYHASGIKVQDVSTPVGLGWRLNAASFAVTRVVRGQPDGNVPFCAIDGTGKVSKDYIWSLSEVESCDGERDIYYFSYPGRSGKMFLDGNSQPQTIPYQDIAISPGVGSASIGYWKIIDEAGYTYYFGETAASREETTYYVGDHVANNFTLKHTYVSTWYLTKVEAPSGVQVATFSYSAGADVTYYNYSVRVFDCLQPPATVVYKRVDLKIKINSPKYISSIGMGSSSLTGLTSCTFEYDNNRSDLAGALRLSSISFRDASNIERKKFYLESSCFDHISGFVCSRLKLSAIKEGISNPITTHTFVYNENSLLPFEESYYTNHYGFFNVNYGDFNVFASNWNGYPDQSVAKVSGVCSIGRDKGADSGAGLLSGTLALILLEVQYPTGGKTVLNYDVSATARVTSISQYDGTTLVARSSYSYVGQTYKTPVYHYYNTEANPDLLIRSSNSYNSIFDLNGLAVGYSTVTETLLDGSQVIRTFENFSDYPDTAPEVKKYRVVGTSETYLGTSNSDSSPFAPYSTYAYMRGLPKTVEIKDNLGNTVHKKEYNYMPGTIINTTWNMAAEPYHTVPGNYHFYVADYYLRSQVVYLNYEKTYIYDQENLSNSTIETNTYTYHGTHKTLPVTITSKLNVPGYAGPEQKITLRYPYDVTGGGTPPASPQAAADGVWSLFTNHILVPVEKLSYYKEIGASSFNIVGGELSTFRKNPVKNKPYVKELYKLDLLNPIASLSTPAVLTSGGTVFSYDNTRYRLMKTYNFDNTNVRVTSMSDYDGITQNLEWDATSSLVTGSYTTLGGVQFKSQYSYNSIYGVLSETDFNNRTYHFEYDKMGRLKLTKDTEGNILETYRYNTKNVSEFEVDYTMTGNLAQAPVVFTSTKNAETAGVTKYVWDFGDGVVEESTTPEVSHTYTATGTYTTKLSKINPEYGTTLTTKPITINPALSVYISGLSSINRCNFSYETFTVTGSGGCQPLSYVWSIKPQSGGSWSQIGTGTSISFYAAYYSPDTYQIRCVATDGCGNSMSAVNFLHLYNGGGCN